MSVIPVTMGQSMVAITEADCTGCDLCIPHCPFEALLPLNENPKDRKHKKRPVIVLASQCVGCLSCIGSCPTKALHEILIPPITTTSPLLIPADDPQIETILRWGRKGIGWAKGKNETIICIIPILHTTEIGGKKYA